MSTYPPRARDVDETINAIVGEAAVIALKTGRALRLVGSIDANRPVGLAVSPEPTMPVVLALGDFAQLLALADETPMRNKLEGTRVTVGLTMPEVAAVCAVLERDGSEWARDTQEGIARKLHPSLMPPADECNPHGIPRPVLA
jgi:hypothetical protein